MVINCIQVHSFNELKVEEVHREFLVNIFPEATVKGKNIYFKSEGFNTFNGYDFSRKCSCEITHQWCYQDKPKEIYHFEYSHGLMKIE